ncbi:hypothetical protein SLEP1_g37806 [Rubroshorea leprosula]|uniref:Uncharacterized protein n=1 Tax=Rubroshorea leprosula TaxID=152421 RepID=A0AAV5KWI4_9ROSI|nr:hypothetical protein SLEP1_g37806 [Rubroshorea leprosula]
MKATSLGYDLVRKTIAVPKEWWEARENENSKIKKFRLCGIEPQMEERYQEMFSGAIPKLDFAYTPSAGTLPPKSDLNAIETLNDVSGNSSENDSKNVDIIKRKPSSHLQHNNDNKNKKRKVGETSLQNNARKKEGVGLRC